MTTLPTAMQGGHAATVRATSVAELVAASLRERIVVGDIADGDQEGAEHAARRHTTGRTA